MERGEPEYYTAARDLAILHGQISTPPAHLIPDILYHYTDAGGLLGMLSNSSFWASDYRYLNDRSEVIHTSEIVKRVVSERLKDCNNDVEVDFYKRILRGDHPERTVPLYIFSLSEDPDSLSQWRGYAKDGRGFTVGFDAAKFLESRKIWDDGFDLRRVEYDENIQGRAVSKAVDAFVELIRSDKYNINDATPAHEFFEMAVMAQSCSNKHSSFSGEREWRTVGIGGNETDSNFRVRARGCELVPYVTVSIKAEDGRTPRLPIKSIGIGPGFADQSQRLAIEQLCRKLGYEVEVYVAASPYRAL